MQKCYTSPDQCQIFSQSVLYDRSSLTGQNQPVQHYDTYAFGLLGSHFRYRVVHSQSISTVKCMLCSDKYRFALLTADALLLRLKAVYKDRPYQLPIKLKQFVDFPLIFRSREVSQ